MRSTLAALLLVLVGCNSDQVQRRKDPEPPPVHTCGDGHIDTGEQCDGAELAGRSCTGEGFDFGTLACDDHCQISTSGCGKICGNGKLDPGEQCDGAVGTFSCSDWGYQSCSASCRVESLHCVPETFQRGSPVVQSSGGAAVLTDLEPEGYGDLVTAVPDFARLQTHTFDTTRGFSEARKVQNGHAAAPSLPVAADLDGDGHIDLASINEDGTADRYRYESNTFKTESLTSGFDAGAGASCEIGRWIGAGKAASNGPSSLYALACPSGSTWQAVYVFPGGSSPGPVRTIDVSGITAATVADDDGDGFQDLFLAVGTSELLVLHAPDFPPASPVSLGTSATLLAATDLDGDGDTDVIAYSDKVRVLENLGTSGFAERSSEDGAPVALIAQDLDLDGRPDYAWLEDGKVEIRRNLGNLVFAPRSVTTGTGAPISMSTGDIDGDGDPDLAVAVGNPGGSTGTTTHIFLNEVR